MKQRAADLWTLLNIQIFRYIQKFSSAPKIYMLTPSAPSAMISEPTTSWFQRMKEKFLAYTLWLCTIFFHSHQIFDFYIYDHFNFFSSRSFRISPLCHSISKLINLLFIQFTEEKVIQKRTTDHFSLWRLFREDCFGVFKVSKKRSSIH